MNAAALSVGRHTLLSVRDGEFYMSRDFSGDERAHRELADADGVVRMPIGAFLLPGDEPLLVDAGLGPGFPRPDVMHGGALLDNLTSLGVQPVDVAHLAISHLHPDHIGCWRPSRAERHSSTHRSMWAPATGSTSWRRSAPVPLRGCGRR